MEEPRLLQLPDDRRNILLGGNSIDVKRLAQLLDYVRYAVLTVALIPDVSGGRVQLVNQLRFKIQYHELALHVADFDIGSVLGTESP